MLQTNINEWKAELKKLRPKLDITFQQLLRANMMYMIRKVAERTPVSPYEREDPGRAAGSWTISRGQPGAFVIPEG